MCTIPELEESIMTVQHASGWTIGPVDCSAREAGYDESKIARLREHLGRRIEAGKLQYAGFLLARNGRVFVHQAMGLLTHKIGSVPFQLDSLKWLASISKVFTATAIMKLIENGQLWLEQPVKSVLPEFDTEMHRGINIWHLLTHTSGLQANTGYFCEPYCEQKDVSLFKQENWLVKDVLNGPVQSRPGETWSYCTRGYTVLAEIVTRVSGRHFYDFVREEIFQPLGMNRSFFEIPKEMWPEMSQVEDWEGEPTLFDLESRGAPNGGGGVASTLHDLFKFGQCFLNGGEYQGARILGKKTVQEMTRNQLSEVPAFHWGKRLKSYRFGLGWGFFCDGSTVGPATFNHIGWGWSDLFVDPIEKFIYVIFVGDHGAFNPEHIVAPRTIAFAGIL